MATATAPKTAVPSRLSKFETGKWAKKPGKFLESTGKVGWFAIESLREIPHAITASPAQAARTGSSYRNKMSAENHPDPIAHLRAAAADA